MKAHLITNRLRRTRAYAARAASYDAHTAYSVRLSMAQIAREALA